MLGILLLLTAVNTAWSAQTEQARLSLAGEWSFQLDPASEGLAARWYDRALDGKARLPGSLDVQGLSIQTSDTEEGATELLNEIRAGRVKNSAWNTDCRVLNRLTQEYEYVGPAWYQKEVSVPEDWTGKRVSLFLERCKWSVKVWVDGRYVDEQDSLCTGQEFDLTDFLEPGETHRLTLCVDNTVDIWLGHHPGFPKGWVWAHSLTVETQTNWNGILGTMELRAVDPVSIRSIQAYPDFEKKVVRVHVYPDNHSSKTFSGTLRLACVPGNGLGSVEQEVEIPSDNPAFCLVAEMPFQDGLKLWDEFSPELYQISAQLTGTGSQDAKTITTGFRKFEIDGKHFRLNDRRIFLRGNLECCIFPKTGHPPMDVAAWKELIRTAQAYGLNHFRFHSWCPPKAAFVAADELGFYYQVETPLWDGSGNIGDYGERAAWLLEEVERIVDAYGNHPSFLLMSMGNELVRKADKHKDPELYLQYLVEHLRKRDPRHFYTCTTSPISLRRNDDYFVSKTTDLGHVRDTGQPSNRAPSPDYDVNRMLKNVDRPFLVHEIGQFVVYPDYSEIRKYTGHLKPYNLMAFRNLLEARGMSYMAETFNRDSGRYAAMLYKEALESIFRSSEYSGFQALGFQDYPGQGTALIGLLDAFWETKGIVTPEEVRRWCSETVPLARFAKRVWSTNDSFSARLQVSHFGRQDLLQVRPEWSVKNQGGEVLAQGRLAPRDIPTGGLTELGQMEYPLETIEKPAQLSLEVTLPGTDAQNAWNFWVYPQATEPAIPSELMIAHEWNAETQRALQDGQTVLLLADAGKMKNGAVGRFFPVFWSNNLFAKIPTLGITCDPQHPALSGFPTESYTDWQWHELLNWSQAINLNDFDVPVHPIVQFVPDFTCNDKLGLVFELAVEKGKLLVCTLDVESDPETRPVAHSLYRSLLSYAGSPEFKPSAQASLAELSHLLQTNLHPSSEKPDTGNAVLEVRASTQLDQLSQAVDWSPSVDEVRRQESGFSYRIVGQSFKNAQGSQWVGKQLQVIVKCPRDFSGSLYVHFQDLGNKGREAALFFDGRDRGQFSDYGNDGLWLKLPIEKDATGTNPEHVLDANCFNGPNVSIAGLVLVPDTDD